MNWPQAIAESLKHADTSLCYLGCGYVLYDGHVWWPGERPGPGWHGHGWLCVWRWVLLKGRLQRIRLFKHRWLEVATGRTCHSRPPDEVPLTRYCSLVMVLELLCWLTNGGLERYVSAFPDLGRVDRRTVQRWLSRAQKRAMQTQQAARRALIEKNEPRPFERLFPGGLSPPVSLLLRRWKDPLAVQTLWRGLTILVVGAARSETETSILLAEARRRHTRNENPWLIG